MSTVETNRWVEGPYAPLPAEVVATELEVIGELPETLTGRYLRNGPNPMGGDLSKQHWFTGDAMVHGVRLRDGEAEWYRASWVRSTAVSEALGEAPAPGERHGGFDTANTNVIGLDGRTFAIVEAGGRPVELSFDLETIEHSDLGGTLPNGYTAHPKVDPATGDLHAICYHWALPHLQYVVVGPDARVKQVEPIEVPGSPMVHDCSITESWVVVYDLPVTFSLERAMGGSSFPYGWDEDYGARIGLVPLNGSGADVRWFDVEPCYVFHPLNAYDDGDTVVIDVVRHPKMFASEVLGPDEGAPLLWRWTVDLNRGTVSERQLSDHPLEFPRVDERVVGRQHRWAYAAELTDSGRRVGYGGRALRIDGPTGDVTPIDLGPGALGGEWVMVPNGPDAAEDDGWLMSLVYRPDEDRSELVVLPAEDPTSGPVARVLLPNRVPLGFHGNWIADR